jgi:hypothetical protein
LIGSLEFKTPYLAKVSGLFSALMGAVPVKHWLEVQVGMMDSPLISRFDFQVIVARWPAEPATPQGLAMLIPTEFNRCVVHLRL